MDEAEHLEMRAGIQRRNAQDCGTSTAKGRWYLKSAAKLERQAWELRQQQKSQTELAEKTRLTVHRSPKGDCVELGDTKYPVSSNWADAFEAMLAAGGAGVGLTKIVGKTTRAINQLPQELRDVLSPLPGNKGYVLRLKQLRPTLG